MNRKEKHENHQGLAQTINFTNHRQVGIASLIVKPVSSATCRVGENMRSTPGVHLVLKIGKISAAICWLWVKKWDHLLNHLNNVYSNLKRPFAGIQSDPLIHQTKGIPSLKKKFKSKPVREGPSSTSKHIQIRHDSHPRLSQGCYIPLCLAWTSSCSASRSRFTNKAWSNCRRT